jgi:MoxR-like ATPase
MQAGVETVTVDPDIVSYCVALAAGTRSHPAVKAVALPALAHRITLNPQTWATGVQARDVIATVLDQVPGPATVADRPRP